MGWVFALGVLALGVFHKGFRKTALWLVGIGAVSLAVYIGLAAANHWQI